jgi:TolB-like protein
MRRADTLTVAVEMVDTSSGLRLWGERYSRRAEDLLAIEDDIGRQITPKAARLARRKNRRKKHRQTQF